MDRIAESVVTFVVNAAWQTTVIASIGIVLARSLGRSPARLRFRLAALTLVAAAAAPWMSIVPSGNTSPSRIEPVKLGSPQTQDSVSDQRAPITWLRPSIARSAANVVTIVYLAGALLAAARLLLVGHRTRRLLARAHPFSPGVRISDDVASPATIGRTILLPRSLAGSELLPTALAHERAHVRRRDFTVNALLQLLALPLWFHPLALLLRREIAELREQACDEEAASQSSPHAYAAALVRIASMTVRGDFALGMTSTSIERRVALLRQPMAHSRAAAVLAIAATLAVPAALFAACSRASITPAIARPNLAGRWTLVQSQSDFRMMTPHAYETYSQFITQDARSVSVHQHRAAGGRAEDHAWRVITDGKWRGVEGIPATSGRATWHNGRLTLHMKGPGTHSETAKAWISGGRLICDGDTNRGHFHAVFQREN